MLDASPPYVLVPRDVTERQLHMFRQSIVHCQRSSCDAVEKHAIETAISARPESSSKLQQAQEAVIAAAKERASFGHDPTCNDAPFVSGCQCGHARLANAISVLTAAKADAEGT
jgi:hypothetical protein